MAYTAMLRSLAEEVLEKDECIRLCELISDEPLKFHELLAFDRSLGGPGMHNVSRNKTGAYHLDDRDVFRPYQYCWMYFRLPEEELAWRTRYVVHMCGFHLEALAKRVAGKPRLTLGHGLKNSAVRRILSNEELGRLERFLQAYNASKHDISQTPPDEEAEEEFEVDEAMDDHLFSVEDAVIAYVTCRRLARPLYAHARLKTPRSLCGPYSAKDWHPVPET